MDPLMLRFFERITAVLIGGLAIYLGYRLFLSVPEHKDSDGKVVLPWDISVVMTRVGPGVFFALYGVIAVSLSLIRPLEINSPGRESLPEKGASFSVNYANEPDGSRAGVSKDDRNSTSPSAENTRQIMLSDIKTFNRLANELVRQREQAKASGASATVENSDGFLDLIDRTKANVMLSQWSQDWGDREEFRKWALRAPGYFYSDPPASIAKGAAIFKGETQ
ncbi:MAG: hypothetical protein WAV20_06865 [Blastocatellia bacterium]